MTFDEDDAERTNQIPTIIVGPMVEPGSYAEKINHYNVLRTVEDMYGLAPAPARGRGRPIVDIWRGVTREPPPTAAFTSSCTQLVCSFDASRIDLPDGIDHGIYSWNFGDGTTGIGTDDHAHLRRWRRRVGDPDGQRQPRCHVVGRAYGEPGSDRDIAVRGRHLQSHRP